MLRAAIATLFLILGPGISSAQPFRSNVLMNITMCADSDVWRQTLDRLQSDDVPGAHRFMAFAIGSGRCAHVPVANYQPEAIVEEWAEDDGSGSPGVIVAGHLLDKKGRKRQRAFIWVTPDLLREHFSVDAPRT